MAALVHIEDLSVRYRLRHGEVAALESVSVSVDAGQVVALVGESGSGKSTLAQTINGLLPRNARITGRSVRFRGQDITRLGRRFRRLRGQQIGYVPQDPMVSLDPVVKIGRQVSELFTIHRIRGQRTERVVRALEAAGLPDAQSVLGKYPHELSGGMRQRVLIGIALALDPALVIADEPTTALDVTVQRRIMDFITSTVRERDTGLLLVTHDLGLAADYADDIVVLAEGRVQEQGRTRTLFAAPRADYTKKLLDSVPLRRGPRPGVDVPVPVAPTPPIVVRDAVRVFGGGKHGGPPVRAVDGVSFEVSPGEAVGLVGESGSGKSTVARSIMMLEQLDSGSIEIGGRSTATLIESERRELRRTLQLIYQNPYGSLDPRFSVERAIREGLDTFSIGTQAERRAAVHTVLDQVGLPRAVSGNTASELSGGQRQRVAIARALVLGPKILVCDEPVSALDVTVQAQIIDLIHTLQSELGLSLLFISHDLAVVRELCHRVLVMRRGSIVESGRTAEVFDHPTQEYTRELVAAIPDPRPGGLVEHTAAQ